MSLLSKYKAVIIILISSLFIPVFFKSSYIILTINQVLVSSVAVMGLYFITAMAGQMNLGMAGIMGLGAYTSALLTVRIGLSPILAFLISCFIGIIIGQLIGRPSLRISGIYLALSTLILGETIELLLNNASKITFGSSGVRNIPNLRIFGFVFNTGSKLFYLYLFIVTILMIVSLRIKKGKWGRAFIAVRDNPSALEACGTELANVKVVAFTLSAVFGCISGSMYAHMLSYVAPTVFTFDYMIKFIMMMILGGIDSVFGVILGATIITLLPELLRFLGDYYWLTFSVLMFIITIVYPYGFISIIDKFKNKIFKIRT